MEDTSSLEGKVYIGAMEGEPTHYVYADQIWQNYDYNMTKQQQLDDFIDGLLIS